MCSILTKRTRGVPPPASGAISTQISAVYVIVVELNTLTLQVGFRVRGGIRGGIRGGVRVRIGAVEFHTLTCKG